MEELGELDESGFYRVFFSVVAFSERTNLLGRKSRAGWGSRDDSLGRYPVLEIWLH
jgi:hypothetical protein